ncbi:MAG: outer membrane protein transport protein [Pseudomonadota bacterium]|jgi:long-chain fatty acid transport protein|nr:outer membrane protein transport protein [Pseudomonadota bacterium]
MIMRKLSLSCAALAILGAGVSLDNTANAAGFYIQEQSSYHLGMSFAGSAADPVDASTIYYNPAGMAHLDGMQAQLGSHLLIPNSKIKDTGSTATTAGGFNGALSGEDSSNPYDPTPVPNAFVAYPVTDSQDWWVGFALTAPFGLANEYDDDFFGRYDSTQSSLKVLDFAPTVAWKMNDKWSFGAGVNIQYADAHLENAMPSPALAGPDVATDGYQDLSGDNVGLGYNIGALWTPTDDWRVGLHYRHGVAHDLEGRVVTVLPTALGGTKSTVTGNAELDLPAMATFAASHDINDRWTVQGHAIWFGWSSFDDIPVSTAAGDSQTLQEYNDTYALALGFKYKLDDQWELKAGFQFDETPTEDGFRSTRTPDGDRNWYSVGATYKLNEKISIDLSGTYIDIDEEEIDLTKNFDYGVGGSASVDINGETEGDVAIVAVGLSYKF